MCRAEYLNYLRVREWQELESQLRRVAKQLGLTRGPRAPPGHDQPDGDGIHQALLSGLLSQVGLRDPEKRDYLGARGTRFSIFPGLRPVPEAARAGDGRPSWSRPRGSTPGSTPPSRRSGPRSSAPTWSSGPTPSRTGPRSRAAVLAHERVTLYGVPLVADRLVSYGKVDREVSRELFIRHALVYGEWSTQPAVHGPQPRAARARSRSSSTGPAAATSWSTSTRCSTSTTPGWGPRWSPARTSTPGGSRPGATDPELLTFDPAMLVNDAAHEVTAQDYPDRVAARTT